MNTCLQRCSANKSKNAWEGLQFEALSAIYLCFANCEDLRALKLVGCVKL